MDRYEEPVAISFSAEPSEGEEDDFEAPPGIVISPEALGDLIVRNISEDSWANRRNSLKIDDERLLVVHTPEVQDRIAALLATMRARRAHMVAVEVAVVPSTVLDDTDARQPWISKELFEKALTDAGSRGSSIALTAYNEQTTNGLSGHLRTTATHPEVNQTGVIPVINPVVVTLPIGISLEARPQRIAGTDWFRVDLRVARLEEAGEVLRRRTLFADIEFVPLLEQSIETMLLLEAGRAGVAGRFRERRPDGSEREFAVLARVRPVNVTTASAGRPPTETFHLRLYDLSFLLERFGRHGTLSGAAWLTRVRADVDPEAWIDDRSSVSIADGPILRVVARTSTHRAVQAWVDERIRERARVASIEVSVYAGPVDAVTALLGTAEGTVYLDGDWRDSAPGNRLERRFHSLSVGAVDGRVRARGFEARSFIADVEGVSGGTGFAIIETPAGIVESAGDGFWLDASVAPRLDPDSVTLSLAWARCRTTFESSLAFYPNVQLAHTAAAADESDSQRVVAVRMPFVIDLPRQEREFCRATVPMRTGRSTIVRVEKRDGATASLIVARVDLTAAMGKGEER